MLCKLPLCYFSQSSRSRTALAAWRRLASSRLRQSAALIAEIVRGADDKVCAALVAQVFVHVEAS